MKIGAWKTGKPLGLALAVAACCGLAGCSFFPHRELTAPCSDYKAASFVPASAPGDVPCNDPLPMVRPPWTAALDQPLAGPVGG